MKRHIYWLVFAIALAVRTLNAQDVAVKTNALYWALTTPNAAVEVALSQKVTLNLLAAYNPWTFADDKKMHFWR